MYCKHCGTKLPDDARFCIQCGGNVSDSAPASDSSAGSTFPPSKSERKVFHKKNFRLKLSTGKKARMILIGAVSLVLVILIGVLISNAVDHHKRNTVIGNIPDPETYFGVTAKHDSDSYAAADHLELRFEGDKVTEEMVLAYVELLESAKYPFVLDHINEFSLLYRNYIFKYNGSEELYDDASWQIIVEFDHSGKKPSTTIDFLNVNNFEFVASDVYTADASAPTEPEAESKAPESPPASSSSQAVSSQPVSNALVLPDPTAFFGVTPNIDEPADTAGRKLYYVMEIDDGLTAAQEYVKLLSSQYNFELSKQDEASILYLIKDVYTFDYTGAESIAEANDKYYLANDYTYFSEDLVVVIEKNTQKETTCVTIFHSDDLILEDCGDRASTAPKGSSSGSGGTSISGGSNNTRTPCSICNRTGECQTCGGDGYLWSSANDKENRNCWKCRNHNGKCTNCNGSGWLS